MSSRRSRVVHAVGAQPMDWDADGEQPHKFTIDAMSRFRRFLVLGSENPIYCADNTPPGLESVLALRELLRAGQGVQCVETIAAYAAGGRVAKLDNLTFALAYCCRSGDEATRKKVYAVLNTVCGIPTTLFSFLEFFKMFGAAGESKHWGRMHRRGVAAWYGAQPATRLAMQVTKYANRKGWTHRDVLRLCHAVPASLAHNALYAHVCRADEPSPPAAAAAAGAGAGAGAGAKPGKPPGEATKAKSLKRSGSEGLPAERQARKQRVASVAAPADGAEAGPDAETTRVLAFLAAVDAARQCTEAAPLVALVREHGLVREHCPTPLLGSPVVWEALLERMPLMALLRNLNKLTAVGLLEAGSAREAAVVARLRDEGQLQRARIHPFNALLAMHTYQRGKGELGKMTWVPNRAVCAALEQTFVKCFKNLVPIGARVVVALDVSGSMSSPIANSPLSSRTAAAALLAVCLQQCSEVRTMAFSNYFVELPITRATPLSTILDLTSRLPFQSTDCSLPMRWAQEHHVAADAFVVITDNETNCSPVSPAEALRTYRVGMGIPAAKLVVLATANTPFSIADPNDANMLDMAGLDSNCPAIIADFIAGKLLDPPAAAAAGEDAGAEAAEDAGAEAAE